MEFQEKLSVKSEEVPKQSLIKKSKWFPEDFSLIWMVYWKSFRNVFETTPEGISKGATEEFLGDFSKTINAGFEKKNSEEFL